MANNLSVVGFTKSDLNDDFFSEILQNIDERAVLVNWRVFPLDSKLPNSLLSRTSDRVDQQHSKIIGFLGFHVKYSFPDSSNTFCVDLVLKSKVKGTLTVDLLLNTLPTSNNAKLTTLYKQQAENYGAAESPITELNCVKTLSKLKFVMPEIYWSCLNEEKEIYAFVMEHFNEEKFSHINAAWNQALWKDPDMCKVLDGLAQFHAVYYGITEQQWGLDDDLSKFKWKSGQYFLDSKDPWQYFIQQTHLYSADILNEADCAFLMEILNYSESVSQIIDSSPITFVHYDASPRNLCLRKKNSTGSGQRKSALCLYDWELACFAQPQIDVVHFLLGVIPLNTEEGLWHRYVKMYLCSLKKYLEESGCYQELKCHLEFDQFLKVFDMCVIERYVNFCTAMGAIMHSKLHFGPPTKERLAVGMQYLQLMTKRYDFLRQPTMM